MIEYQETTKIFGSGDDSVTAISDVSFEIEKGTLVTFLGPPGCGKTTLLRLTNRLLNLTRGKIFVDGNDIMSEDPVKLRQSMGYAIQQVGLFPNKTIHGNIATVPKLLGWDREKIDDRVNELLKMLRLEPDRFRDRYPVELSGGQQQRIGVARCLAADPAILLMDEPFGAIDPINREVIQNEFLGIQNKLKKTIAFVTHDLQEAIKMGDKIAIFREGRLVQYDRPEVLLTQPKDDYIADFVGADRALKVLGILRVEDAMDRDEKYVLKSTADTAEARQCLEDRDVDHCVVVKGDKPYGYITGEILKEAKQGEIKDAAAPYPVLLDLNTTLRDVLSQMLMNDMQMLTVADENGNFAGVIGFRDIQRELLEGFRESESEPK